MRQIVAAQNVGTLEVSTPATAAAAFAENSVEFDSLCSSTSDGFRFAECNATLRLA